MSNWQHDPFAFEDDPLLAPSFSSSADIAVEARAEAHARGARAVWLLAVCAIALAAASLVLGASGGAWATVAAGGLGYALAVVADLRNRMRRRIQRNYRRPWPTACCRLVVFWAAVGAAWLAAAGLAAR